MPDVLSLPQLLDLSIGSPELGAVNFSQLHKLLLEIINSLGLESKQVPVAEPELKKDVKPSAANFPKSSYNALQDKVNKIEQDVSQMSTTLPSSREMIDKVKTGTPLTDLWQYMQVNKRVEANETGVKTVSSFYCTVLLGGILCYMHFVLIR